MADRVGEFHSRTHTTIVMVTHVAEDAMRITDRVLRIEDGHVAAFANIEDLLRGGFRTGR